MIVRLLVININFSKDYVVSARYLAFVCKALTSGAVRRPAPEERAKRSVSPYGLDVFPAPPVRSYTQIC
jgi:hypothetical protein